MDINQHGDIRCDRSEERDNEANNNNHQHVASLEDGLPRHIAAIYRCRMAIVKRIADIINRKLLVKLFVHLGTRFLVRIIPNHPTFDHLQLVLAVYHFVHRHIARKDQRGQGDKRCQ